MSVDEADMSVEQAVGEQLAAVDDLGSLDAALWCATLAALVWGAWLVSQHLDEPPLPQSAAWWPQLERCF